jgi:hypothetical protein
MKASLCLLFSARAFFISCFFLVVVLLFLPAFVARRYLRVFVDRPARGCCGGVTTLRTHVPAVDKMGDDACACTRLYVQEERAKLSLVLRFSGPALLFSQGDKSCA